MGDIKDEVHKLNEALKTTAKYCEENGKCKDRNQAFKILVRDGERRFTKYGYFFNGSSFVYRK